MRRARGPWLAVLLVLLLMDAAFAGPSTVVLAVEGMT
jgi:hypothetical protein